MTVYKLLDDFEEDSEFLVVAIHSQLEDYRVAYLLNKFLGSFFVKEKPVHLASGIDFDNYEWLDTTNEVLWNLIKNKAVIAKKSANLAEGNGLFQDMINEEYVYLLPEWNKVDYLLKLNVSEDFIDIDTIVKRIQQIPNILSSYKLTANQIKTRTNLIF